MASEIESSLEASFTSSGALSGPSVFLQPARSRIFKIIVIGDSNVGKTCLTYRFCAGRFPDRTEATIGVDFRERAVEIDGERIKVSRWRTGAAEGLRDDRCPGPTVGERPAPCRVCAPSFHVLTWRLELGMARICI